MRFPYRTEPIRQALIVIAGLVIVAVLLPIELLRLILLSTAAGAGAWLLFQLLRRRHAVILDADALIVQHSLIGTPRRVEWQHLRGAMESRREGLIVAYEIPPPPPTVTTGNLATAPVALSDVHRQTQPAKPRLRLLVTPAVEGIGALLSEINAHAVQSTFDAEALTRLAKRRRTRGYVLLALAVLGIPIYIYIYMRAIALLR
jgi:hypothetical protein